MNKTCEETLREYSHIFCNRIYNLYNKVYDNCRKRKKQ